MRTLPAVLVLGWTIGVAAPVSAQRLSFERSFEVSDTSRSGSVTLVGPHVD